MTNEKYRIVAADTRGRPIRCIGFDGYEYSIRLRRRVQPRLPVVFYTLISSPIYMKHMAAALRRRN